MMVTMALISIVVIPIFTYGMLHKAIVPMVSLMMLKVEVMLP